MKKFTAYFKYINLNGITCSLPGIFKNISEKDEWYLDWLDNGGWAVSNKNKVVGVFEDCETSVIFFISKADPMPPLTDEQEAEAMQYLEQLLKK